MKVCGRHAMPFVYEKISQKKRKFMHLQALFRSPAVVFGKLALQIKRRPEVMAPEAARPALNAFKCDNVNQTLQIEFLAMNSG